MDNLDALIEVFRSYDRVVRDWCCGVSADITTLLEVLDNLCIKLGVSVHEAFSKDALCMEHVLEDRVLCVKVHRMSLLERR